MKICFICKNEFQEKQRTEKYCSTDCAYDGMKLKEKERTQKMKNQTHTTTIASEKISLTTENLREMYNSIQHAEPKGRVLKEIYVGHQKSFNAWLDGAGVKIATEENTAQAFHGVKVLVKAYMPRNMALLVDQTGEIFGVISYDIVE